jgi:hsp70-interacting protein
VVGSIPTLVKLAVKDSNESVRRKAIYALSSEVRNYQPGLDEAVKPLPESARPSGNTDAGDMEAIDKIIDHLRESSK